MEDWPERYPGERKDDHVSPAHEDGPVPDGWEDWYDFGYALFESPDRQTIAFAYPPGPGNECWTVAKETKTELALVRREMLNLGVCSYDALKVALAMTGLAWVGEFE